MKTLGSKILIINIGSASKKYSIYDGIDELVNFHFESENDHFVVTVKTENGFEKGTVSIEDYKNSLEFLNNYIDEQLNISIDDLHAVSFRVVAPGTYFTKDREIDDEFIEYLEKTKQFDELHIKPVLEEIEKVKKIYKEQRVFAISDSAFHSTKLEESKYYGLSKKLQDENDYKRFGYHGISVESVINRIKDAEGRQNIDDKKILVCHLGGGVSFTAVKDSRSLDNTMGFSPLEGPFMATRSGDIDDVLLMDLYKKENLKEDKDKIQYLFEKSGLLGLSDISGDLRVLRDESFKGNKDASFAIKTYVFNLVKNIMKMISVSKGVDTIVFTGTIGLRADFLRELIIEELRWFGLGFDLEKNQKNGIDSDYFYINSDDSSVKILVCGTDEMGNIAKRTSKLL
jgi:acetate kinase